MLQRLAPNLLASRAASGAALASHAAAGVALACMLGASMALPAAAQPNPPASAAPMRVQSDLKDIRMRALAALPRAGGSASERDGCPWRVIQPKSAAARQVAAQGWAVTSDLPLGAYRAVAFAGLMEPATSGTCNITQGNVGVFDGDRLVALAYGKSPEDAAIGHLTALADGAVRVWDGDIIGSPVGDLRVDADGALHLGRMADEDAVCQGRAKLPNLYGMPIDKARKALAAKGWKPVRARADGEWRQGAFIRRGIVEAESCSGTGLAYCRFGYSGPAGTLSVVTAGENDLPGVVGYEAGCR